MNTSRLATWLFLLVWLPGVSLAQAANTPHEVVQKATDDILILIEEAKGSEDPEHKAFYAGVKKVLEPFIDFNVFTRSVMGPYGTKDYYVSLSKEGRTQYKVDYKRFVETFKDGLITTYSKGLLAFNSQKIEVIPPTDEDRKKIEAADFVEVVQTIRGGDNNYDVVYKMKQNKDGQWLLRNVVIDSINVGQLYRNQFMSSMEKYENDFARVVDNWVIETDEKEEETGS